MCLRILIADDERLAAMALQMYLSDQGYAVRTANSAESTVREGLEFRPNLLLIDYMLGPGQRGTEVAQLLLAELPEMKIMVMTGLPTDRLDAANELSGYNVLAKPLNLDHVGRSVAALVGGAR